MGVRDIMSREAIERALDEYDSLGQDAFLAKYGFGKAYKYILVRDGKRYDAKAILGAAHGYEFPDRGPLASSDFASSEITVKNPLEALGYEIDVIDRTPTRYWIFQANPSVWDVRQAVADFTATDFSILQHATEVKGGDMAFMWESGPSGGLVGLAEVLEDPVARVHRPDAHQVAESHSLQGPHPRADIRVLRAVDPPIARAELKSDPRLGNMLLFRQAQGTNFPLTEEEARVLKQLVDERGHEQDRDPIGSPKWAGVWWVNQREFATERERGVVTAPTRQDNGSRAPTHWRSLTEMQTNDLTFHYHYQHVVAVSRVRRPSVELEADEVAGLPEAYKRSRWLVETEYFVFDEAIHLSEIPVDWRTREQGGPFDLNGKVKQQYLNPVSDKFADLMVSTFGDRMRRGKWLSRTTPRPKVENGESVDDILDLLRRRKNVVFYGPPGTGKTRHAFAIRDQWTAEHGEGSVFKTTFHPSYGYEDFVQGFRPDEDDPGKFHLQPGVLLEACESAKDTDTLLIIDEINRGDVARIFGELITYIERDKRGDENTFVLAQEPGKERFIPESLYVLGTMNTADKSVSLLDVALRRRFAFVEFRPDASVFSTDGFVAQVGSVDLGQLLTNLNARLLNEGIETDRSIGHALLLISDDSLDPAAELRERIRFDIAPLVMEYSYLDRARIGRVLGGLVDDHGHFNLALSTDEVLNRLQVIASATATTAPSLELAPAATLEGEEFAADQEEA